jgi:SAM-dependent methyltransferase
MATPRYTARTADRHVLYEKSVQTPGVEVDLLDRIYREAYGRRPVTLREDFCGTAALSRAWVESRPERTATGVDLDRPTLDWARANTLASMGTDAARLTLLEGNVLTARTRPADVVAAFNFSYFVFHRRAALVAYFKAARKAVAKEGLFVLDILGGPGAQAEVVDRKKVGGFTYLWDQASFNPIDHHYVCHIHFEFPDGSKLRKAFTYDWRLWSLMEVRDALADAGFSRTDVMWEGTDRRTNEGNGVFRKRLKAENAYAWISYIVAVP